VRKGLLVAVGALLLLPLAGARADRGQGRAAAPVDAREWWLRAVDAEGLAPPGSGKPVLIVDRGLDLAQPELAGRPGTVALNHQTIADDANRFHATALASLIGAPGTAGSLLGIYPRARIYSWDATSDGTLDSYGVLRGIRAASRHCPGVLLLSLGFSGEAFFYAKYLLQEGIDLAVSRGCLVVAAAGNGRELGSPAFYPGDLPHVFTVAATGRSGVVAPFSSASPAIDLAAPGVGIPIAVPLSVSPSGQSADLGTSYAAAIVAGAAAWIWTARPKLEASQVAEVLRRSARTLGAVRPNNDTGWGLLDLAKALRTPAPPPDPLEPNDDIWYDLPLGLPNAGSRPLTSAGHPHSVTRASLIALKDPIDVYRVWVPPGGTLTASLTHAAGLTLRLWSDQAPSVLETRAELSGDLLATDSAESGIHYQSRSGRARILYVEVALPQKQRAAHYTLTLSVKSPNNSFQP
jgi:hypothetical protein